MAKQKITVRSLDALKAKAKRTKRSLYCWDGGFGCRVSPSGEVSWLAQTKVGGRGGKTRRTTLTAKTLDEARASADEWVRNVKGDPDLPTKRRQQLRAQRDVLDAKKLGDAVALYIKRNRKPGRYWDELEARFRNEIMPALGPDTRIASITKAELRNLIEAKQDAGHPGGARLLFAALRPFFKWCVERDVIEKSPLDDIAPPKPLKARDRILTDAEVKSFWKATEADKLFGPFYRLLLLTAQRREEVGAMHWSEVDLREATWVIPKERTKNGKEHLVHLSAQALAILEGLPKRQGYVFTTTGETPISGYGKAKARLDELMGDVPAWRVHDLRRTAASGMAKLGFQPHIVERVLNHISGAQGGLVGVYQRYEYLDERKRALAAWGQYVTELVSSAPKKTNVVPLRAS